MEAAAWLDLTNSESPEFVGLAVAVLVADPDVIRHTGTVVVAASVAAQYGFTDIDGKSPRPLTLADDSGWNPSREKRRLSFDDTKAEKATGGRVRNG